MWLIYFAKSYKLDIFGFISLKLMFGLLEYTTLIPMRLLEWGFTTLLFYSKYVKFTMYVKFVLPNIGLQTI